MDGILKRDKLQSCGRVRREGGRKRMLSCEDRVYLMAAAKGLEDLILFLKGEVLFAIGRGYGDAEVQTIWT